MKNPGQISTEINSLSVRGENVPLPSGTAAVLRIASDVDGGLPLEIAVRSTGRRASHGPRSYGLLFHGSSGDRFRFIARVMFGDISPIRARQVSRYVRLGVLTGSAVFAASWIKQLGRGVAYLAFRRAEAPSPTLAAEAKHSAA